MKVYTSSAARSLEDSETYRTTHSCNVWLHGLEGRRQGWRRSCELHGWRGASGLAVV